MIKEDCFAAATRFGQPYCRCLTETVCLSGGCSFYKSKLQFLHDLVAHNGTTDLRQIGETYAAGHVEKGESE
jgi:hypothetical protein